MSWRTRKRGTPKQRGIRFQTSRGGSLGARVRLASEQMKGKRGHPFVRYDKEYDYWSVPRPLISNGIEWGFDFVAVTSPSAWHRFLRKHKFRQVDQAPNARTNQKYTVYRNPDGLFVVTQYPKPRQGDFLLGYMRFEAPKAHAQKLKRVLADFRGPTQCKGWDTENPGGIATYVKEESPRDAQFI